MLVQRAVGLAACVTVALGCAWSLPANAQAAKGSRNPPAAKQQDTASASFGPEATLIGQFGSWGAYVAAPGGKKVCFAMAKPSTMKTKPENRPRDPAYAFVSTRPNERVVNEVSIMIGYPLKPGSEGALEVAGNRYAMYSQGDGLWIKNAAEEDKMVEALRKGSDVIIKGVSSRGTETTDTYSLKGLAQALDRLAQDCKR